MLNRDMVCWYPMRITYGREEKIKEHLDMLSIENFLPMHNELVTTAEGNKRRRLVPAVPNLLFVHTSQAVLTNLKMTRREFSPMCYMLNRTAESANERILRVPDKQMENFMRVASVQDDTVMFLQANEFLRKKGQRVRIIDGDFAGVEGVVKRIQKNKRVVVQLDDIAAVAIAFVPSCFLQIL